MSTFLLPVSPYEWTADPSTSDKMPEADQSAIIVLESDLGFGAYGTVFRGRSSSYPAHVCACKLFYRNKSDPNASEGKLKDELRALSALPSMASQASPLTCFYGALPLSLVRFGANAKRFASKDVCDTILLTEYINGGALTSWWKRFDDAVDFDCIFRCLRQCTAAVQCLHDQIHLLHRDIKPANFLVRMPHMPVSEKGINAFLSHSERSYLLRHSEMVLSDFGEATSCDGDSEMGSLRRILGTPGFCAPEILSVWGCQTDCLYGTKADIWSLGAVFYVYFALGVHACDQGMLSIFSSFPETSSLFSSEALSILLLSKCIFPTLMQLRYGAFSTTTAGDESAPVEPQNQGTLSDEAYTRYTVMDEAANAQDQWKQHVEQFAKMQHHMRSRWSSVPDVILQMIDSMMAPEPSQRPAASLLLNRLKGIEDVPVQPCGQWNRLFAFQMLLEWHVVLMDVDSCLEELVTTLQQATEVDRHTIRVNLPSILQFKTYIQNGRMDLPSLSTPLKNITSLPFQGAVPKPEALLNAFSHAYVTGGEYCSLTEFLF